MKNSARNDAFQLALLAIFLVAPLFRIEYLDNWPSIESTFIADARMLRNNLPHPGWQPLWYTGTRFDYIYPPALRYGTALLSLVGGISTARAYHLYIGFFYVLGILAVWWLVRTGSGSRWQALLAGAATALVSPSMFLLNTVRMDNSDWFPQRLWVLVRYGEGPHMTALAILPAALGASLLALRQWRPRWLVAAGALSALVVANNFYGAVALAIFFPILLWSVFITARDGRVWLRGLAIAALAWFLCAFWLTPSYLRITMANLGSVAEPGNVRSTLAGLAAVTVFAAVSWWCARGRVDCQWPVFVAGVTFLLGFHVLGFFYLNLRIAGDTKRLVPELDLALTMAALAAASAMWPRDRSRLVAGALLLGLFAPAVIYLEHSRKIFPRVRDLESQYVRQLTRWVETNLPGARILPVGMLRLWFDVWEDNAQMDGGSSQGLLNRQYPAALWQIRVGDRGELARLWLQASGTDAVIVPEPGSRENYLDFEFPGKFRGVLPELWNDGQKTTIYRVPRVHPGLGRVVDDAQLRAVPPFQGGDDEAGLQRYVAQVERPGQALVAVNWKGFDHVTLATRTGAGESVLLQQTFDPSWRAQENGRPVPIRPEPIMGFMLLSPGPGQHTIQMEFATPPENRVGQGMFLLAAVVCGWLVWRGQPGADERT